MALTLTGNVLSKISFCDKQCSNVNDNKFKAQVIQNIDTKYKIQIVTRDYNILTRNGGLRAKVKELIEENKA